jgi:hypothetical protein
MAAAARRHRDRPAGDGMIVYRLTKCEGGQVSPSILDHTCSLHLARHNNILSSTHVSVGSKADFEMPRMDVR